MIQFLLLSVVLNNSSLTDTVFEKSNGTETATYQQTIDYYQNLADAFPQISMQTMGQTDSGKPLHIVTFNSAGQQSFAEIRKTKSILLINNGIHPGESDGIDATMMLFRDLVEVKSPKNVVIVTIPIYNIGGSLNRAHSKKAIMLYKSINPQSATS